MSDHEAHDTAETTKERKDSTADNSDRENVCCRLCQTASSRMSHDLSSYLKFEVRQGFADVVF